MWHVEEEKEAHLLDATAELNTEEYGKPLPDGKVGEIQNGHVFYEMICVRDDDGKIHGVRLEYMASQIGVEPTLRAVTKSQLKRWQKSIILAKPAKFVWK